MRKFKNKLSFEFEVIILSIGKIFSNLLNDILIEIRQSNKKYHWLIGSCLYMLINTIIPMYYVFTGNINGLLKDGFFNSESGDFTTYLNSFKLSVYIFLITLSIFLIIEFKKLRKSLSEWVRRKKSREELDDLLEKYTIPPKEGNY